MPARSNLSNSPNHFLASLPPGDLALIEPHLRPIELQQGLVLYVAHDTIERVYFPHDGVISLVVGLADGRFVEAGMFGRNGVVGGGAALDGRTAINQAIAQVAGSGSTIETGLLSRFVSESDTLRMALMGHEQIIYAHTQQIAACNATHHVDERLCRWLMQTRDLLVSDTLPLTQEFLSQMLGVQRSSVTIVARKLQESGLIDYRRGRIHILDVESLRDSCCECYQAINDHFGRLVGWRPNVNNLPRRADH
ncbi:MAG: Crp/Fnr family transcriptional regulator [Xanthobacteraceae bacterium]